MCELVEFQIGIEIRISIYYVGWRMELEYIPNNRMRFVSSIPAIGSPFANSLSITFNLFCKYEYIDYLR